jgi:hypothetical protein
MSSARVVWLNVREFDAVMAMARAVDWIEENRFPDGLVLRVPKNAPPVILSRRK